MERLSKMTRQDRDKIKQTNAIYSKYKAYNKRVAQRKAIITRAEKILNETREDLKQALKNPPPFPDGWAINAVDVGVYRLFRHRIHAEIWRDTIIAKMATLLPDYKLYTELTHFEYEGEHGMIHNPRPRDFDMEGLAMMLREQWETRNECRDESDDDDDRSSKGDDSEDDSEGSSSGSSSDSGSESDN